MPGIAIKEKSAGQSASKIFLRRGFMARYARTLTAEAAQRLATLRAPYRPMLSRVRCIALFYRVLHLQGDFFTSH